MITEQGYTRRTYQEILDDKIEKARELFGEDIDTSDLTPLGKYIRINAYDQAETEETAEMIYYAIFPQTAIGTGLDRLCTFVNITRNQATAALYKVKITGTAGETVPLGFLVGTESELQYYNTVDTVIGEDGTAEIVAECTTAGVIGNVMPSDICVIVNPDANVSAVQGIACIASGDDTESDTDLRARFMASRAGLGSCNEQSLISSLMRIDGVTSVAVVVNDTNDTDASGRPPHSFECYVSGGETKHDDIAEAIYEKKPIGIKTCGNIAHTIKDDGGYDRVINFSHTTYIDVRVKAVIKTDSTYQESGDLNIYNNVASYINGLGVGVSVILSALYGKIHAVTGVKEVTEILLSTDGGGTYSANNVNVNTYESARCVSVDIEVV